MLGNGRNRTGALSMLLYLHFPHVVMTLLIKSLNIDRAGIGWPASELILPRRRVIVSICMPLVVLQATLSSVPQITGIIIV